jgi:DNA-binding SARP family transcriptional activator/class 3 adenylate cyclase
VEFGLLGPIAVWRDGRELALGGAKQRAVLAILLLRPNELVPTEKLIDELWDGRPPATAVKALQVHVSQLRKVLGDGVIETRPGGYVLRVEPDALDFQRFEKLVDQGRRLLAGGAAAEGADLLRRSLALWRGPPLADFQYEPFARNEIGRLEELRHVAVEQRLEGELALGRHAEVVGELEALVRDQPLREGPRRLLILALYRSGRQADALAAYRDARETLLDELGLDPGQALQQLEQAILRQDPGLDLPAAPPPAAAVSAPPPREPSPPVDWSVEGRKTVTVLFCDVVAFSDLAERLDPEYLRNVLSEFFEQAAAILEHHGGTVEKFIGDEVMAVFGVPVVHEDDALRAVRAAVELRAAVTERQLEVRIGVNTGEVVAGDPAAGHGFVTGEAIARGKRLEEAAAPGEIVIGTETQALVAHAVASTPLDGATGFRLDSFDPQAGAVPRRDDTRYVGRARELEWLRDLYEQASSGSGSRRVTIVGEPGIGKSRLGREVLAALEPKPTLLVGRCPPYGSGITYWPLREVLRQAGRDSVDLSGSSHEVFAMVRHLLVELAADRPVLVVFDDVHWAEPMFLDLVEDLTARLGEARVLLLCLARPQLAEQRPAWVQPPADALVLEPLTQAESELLVESLGAPPDLRPRIAEAAEGNPLFAEQLAAIADEFGAGAMPGSIRGVLHERLDRLDRGERSVLERGAVAGRSFSLGLVLELSPPDERDDVQSRLLSLIRRRFIRPDPLALDEGFRFQHALIRDAVYDAMPKAVRADLHQQLGEHLAAQRGEDALVGHHFEQAFAYRRELGRTDADLGVRAGRLLLAAAQEALGRSDLPAAISLLERSRSLLSPDDAAQPSLQTELGYARIRAGDFAGAEHDLEDAIETARRLDDRPAELRALVERQFARTFAGSESSAEENTRLALEAAAELEDLGDELGQARAWWLKADGDVFAGRWRERVEALRRALDHARRASDDLDFVGTLSGLLAQALHYGPTPVPEAIAQVERLLEDAGSDRALRASVSTWLAGLLAMQGAFADARRVYADAVATNEELALRLRRASHRYVAAQIELLAGDTSAAEQELRASTAALRELGARNFEATHAAFHADVLCTLGHGDEAEALARGLAGSAPADDLIPQVLRRTALARVLARRNELQEARELATEALVLTEGIEFPDLRVAALAAAAEVETGQGRPEPARGLLAEARRIMEAKGNLAAVRALDSAASVLSLA